MASFFLITLFWFNLRYLALVFMQANFYAENIVYNVVFPRIILQNTSRGSPTIHLDLLSKVPGKHHILINRTSSCKIFETTALLDRINSDTLQSGRLYWPSLLHNHLLALHVRVLVYYHIKKARILLQQSVYHVCQTFRPTVVWNCLKACGKNEQSAIKGKIFGTTDGSQTISQRCRQSLQKMYVACRFF